MQSLFVETLKNDQIKFASEGEINYTDDLGFSVYLNNQSTEKEILT